MKGDNIAAEQKFDISPCWVCDCCQWVDNFCINKCSLEEILKMGDAPSETNVKHTLFLEPKTLALLKYASLVRLKPCSISFFVLFLLFFEIVCQKLFLMLFYF